MGLSRVANEVSKNLLGYMEQTIIVGVVSDFEIRAMDYLGPELVQRN